MRLDLSFLDVRPGRMPSPSRPVNVFDILSDAWRETRVDMTLQFFLDPNERHGLGSLVIDALLRVLDGASLVGPLGKTAGCFIADDYLGSDAWDVSTQSEYVDVLAANPDLGLAIVLENKIGHELNNPLDRYATHALRREQITAVLVAVLAPERRLPTRDQEDWLSRSITYGDLNDAIRRAPGLIDHLLSPADRDQQRSLDLLQQFIEARSGGLDVSDLAAEAARVDEWRAMLEQHGEAIQQFLTARSQVIRVIRARSRRLVQLIADQFSAAGLMRFDESHSGSKTQTWNLYYFPEVDWTVELKMSIDPTNPPIFVYDYQGRNYQSETEEPLGLDWRASDEDVALAFVNRAKAILERADRELRGGARPGELSDEGAPVVEHHQPGVL